MHCAWICKRLAHKTTCVQQHPDLKCSDHLLSVSVPLLGYCRRLHSKEMKAWSIFFYDLQLGGFDMATLAFTERPAWFNSSVDLLALLSCRSLLVHNKSNHWWAHWRKDFAIKLNGLHLLSLVSCILQVFVWLTVIKLPLVSDEPSGGTKTCRACKHQAPELTTVALWLWRKWSEADHLAG